MNIRKLTLVSYSSFTGMTLQILQREKIGHNGFRCKYAAANDGPVFWVEHYKNADGKVPLAEQRARVAAALSTILGPTVRWDADRGYSDRASGTGLAWDQRRQRFTVTR